MTDKNQTTKFISALLIVSILLPSVLLTVPRKVQAQMVPVTDTVHTTVSTKNSVGTWLSEALHAIGVPSTVVNTGLHLKDFAYYLLQQILMQVARTVLAKMTQATINWINSDFHGAPLFLENPTSFFGDIAKSEIKTLVNMFGLDPNKFPFGKQFSLNIIDSYKRQLEDNTRYTLSAVTNDANFLNNYRNDFNYGGWSGFLTNTQYPQNNYIGFNMKAEEELQRKLEGTVQNAAQKVQTTLQQGMGFLSPQTCPSNPAYNNGVNEFLKPSFQSKTPYQPPTSLDLTNGTSTLSTDSLIAPPKIVPTSMMQVPGYVAPTSLVSGRSEYDAQYQASLDQEKADWNKTNNCPGGLVNTTPGSVVGNHIMDAMGSGLRQTELGAALGNSLSAIFDALLNHFLDKGLNALASTVNPAPSKDNWSYNGNTLNGSTTSSTTGGTGTLNIPQNVSVSVGETTSTTISGGVGPYIIGTEPNVAVATAQVSGDTLTVNGVGTGTTSITVTDSSVPSQTVNIVITANIFGVLVVSPANILADINNSISATISGGTTPYFMQTGPNETIATAVFSDTSLVVIGNARGQTSIIIRDSSTPSKVISIPIIISGPADLVIPDVSVGLHETGNTTISGGVGPYIVLDQLNPMIATAQISDTTLTITGVALGTTSVIIQDSSSSPKSVAVNIKVGTLNIPKSVSVGVNESSDITMSGGVPPYTIKTAPADSPAIATAQVSGATLTVSGVAPGMTSVTVADFSGQTVVVQIKVEALNIQQSVSVGVNESSDITMSGGVGLYKIETWPTETVAKAQISNSTDLTTPSMITITGVGRGTTSVTVADSSTPAQTSSIQITVP